MHTSARNKYRFVGGFTLVELMVVIIIVSILASVAVPVLRGRIDSAKWSEGKAMMGTIAIAIRSYHANKGPSGDAPTSITGNGATELGFAEEDLTGTYFSAGDFAIDVSGMDPLEYEITCTAGGGGKSGEHPANPGGFTLDQDGTFVGID